jgi:hypothetical protein
VQTRVMDVETRFEVRPTPAGSREEDGD